LQFFAIDHVEHSCALRAHHGIAPESVEMEPLRECGCDLWRGNNGTERSAVANSFGHRHDVGHHILSLKSPVVCTRAPESCLHFIGDTHAAGRAHILISVLQVILREHHASADALN
jgi:hypothetical protein